MWACISVDIHTRMYMCGVHIYTHTCAYVYWCTYAKAHAPNGIKHIQAHTCMRVCINTHILACMRRCMHAYKWSGSATGQGPLSLSISLSIYMYVYKQMYVCMCVCKYWTCVYVHACMCACVCAGVGICMYVCVGVCACAWTVCACVRICGHAGRWSCVCMHACIQACRWGGSDAGRGLSLSPPP